MWIAAISNVGTWTLAATAVMVLVGVMVRGGPLALTFVPTVIERTEFAEIS